MVAIKAVGPVVHAKWRTSPLRLRRWPHRRSEQCHPRPARRFPLHSGSVGLSRRKWQRARPLVPTCSIAFRSNLRSAGSIRCFPFLHFKTTRHQFNCLGALYGARSTRGHRVISRSAPRTEDDRLCHGAPYREGGAQTQRKVPSQRLRGVYICSPHTVWRRSVVSTVPIGTATATPSVLRTPKCMATG